MDNSERLPEGKRNPAPPPDFGTLTGHRWDKRRVYRYREYSVRVGYLADGNCVDQYYEGTLAEAVAASDRDIAERGFDLGEVYFEDCVAKWVPRHYEGTSESGEWIPGNWDHDAGCDGFGLVHVSRK